MIEKNLAAMFKDSAEKIKHYRAELSALDPEVDEHCKGLDELVEYLESQSRALTKKALPGTLKN